MFIVEGMFFCADDGSLPVVAVPYGSHITIQPEQLLDFSVGRDHWASGYYAPDLDGEDGRVEVHVWASLSGTAFCGLLKGMTVRLHDAIHESYHG